MPSGGRRPGAGAKPHAQSEGVKKRLEEAIQKVAEETGKTWEEILAGILVMGKFKEGKVGIREWLAASTLYLNAMVVKSSHQKIDVEVRESGFVELPEIKRPKDEEIAKA